MCGVDTPVRLLIWTSPLTSLTARTTDAARKIKFKGGGQECPPHTFLSRDLVESLQLGCAFRPEAARIAERGLCAVSENEIERFAPGWPGISPRWTSSAKSGVGTALNLNSRVWFTLSHGILNEVYYPRVDQACTRDLGLLVTGANGYFSEEKRHCTFA